MRGAGRRAGWGRGRGGEGGRAGGGRSPLLLDGLLQRAFLRLLVAVVAGDDAVDDAAVRLQDHRLLLVVPLAQKLDVLLLPLQQLLELLVGAQHRRRLHLKAERLVYNGQRLRSTGPHSASATAPPASAPQSRAPRLQRTETEVNWTSQRLSYSTAGFCTSKPSASSTTQTEVNWTSQRLSYTTASVCTSKPSAPSTTDRLRSATFTN